MPPFDTMLKNYRKVTGTNPAANNQIDQVISSDLSELWVVKLTLVTSATAATRTVTVQIQDPDNEVLWQRVSPATQTASQTRYYQFFRELVSEDSAFDGAGYIKLRLPNLPLKSGFRIVTSVANWQTTDDWGAPIFYVAEYAKSSF